MVSVSLVSLWLPILLSAVIVFVLSWLMHMLLPFHRGDFHKVPSEDEVMDSLRRFNIPNGDYMIPHPGSPQEPEPPEQVHAVRTLCRRGPPRSLKILQVIRDGLDDLTVRIDQPVGLPRIAGRQQRPGWRNADHRKVPARLP